MTTRYRRGFTLLELSVVLVIISLITGMAISSGISAVSSARYTATQQKMKTISDALMAYRTANDRLPCPGDLTLSTTSKDYGLEAGADGASAIGVGTGVCTGSGMVPQANFTASGVTNTAQTSAEGSFPALSLGLPADLMVDGWGNRFRYAVDISMTKAGVFTSTPIGCSGNAITVNDVNGNARSQNSLYALISHGPNGHGAYTKNGAIVNVGSTNANELINCHCDSSGVTTTSSGVQTSNPATYVQADASIDPNNVLDSFDDMVIFKERWQMTTDWDKSGNCSFVAYISDGGNEVQEFTSAGVYVKTIPVTGANGPFQPGYMATDRSGNFWVVDNNTGNRLQKFNSNWTWLATLGGTASPCSNCLCNTSTAVCSANINSGTGNGQFSSSGQYEGQIYIDSGGNIWVPDYGNSRIEKFTSAGVYAGQTGNTTSFVQPPECVMLDKSGNIWANEDGDTAAVVKFTSSSIQSSPNTGNYSNPLPASDFVDDPSSCTVDSSGNLWFTLGQFFPPNPVQKWSSSGTLIKVYGSAGTGVGVGQFGAAGMIAIDPSGNVWIYDYRNGGVQILNPSTNTWKGTTGGPGIGAYVPGTITFSATGR